MLFLIFYHKDCSDRHANPCCQRVVFFHFDPWQTGYFVHELLNQTKRWYHYFINQRYREMDRTQPLFGVMIWIQSNGFWMNQTHQFAIVL